MYRIHQNRHRRQSQLDPKNTVRTQTPRFHPILDELSCKLHTILEFHVCFKSASLEMIKLAIEFQSKSSPSSITT